jgi:hypothetical protein
MRNQEAVMIPSSLANVNQSRSIRGIRAGLVVLWGLQVALAALFLAAGGSKLAGAPAMVTLFDAIGVGQWFRYVTGFIEVASAFALLVPSLAAFGALLLASTMVGAIGTHLFIVGGSPAAPALLLLGLLAVLWARREQFAGMVPRRA